MKATQAIELLKTAQEQDLDRIIFQTLSGPHMRFIRQEAMAYFGGDKLPLVKCGVNALKEAVLLWQKEAAKPTKRKPADPNEAPITPTVGMNVVRNCGTPGRVTGIGDNKVEVTLETGSVRRPNVERFSKLYKAA